MDPELVLLLLVMLQIKHMFADFYLQTPIMLINRSEVIHRGRALHCVVHIIGTAACFFIAGVPVVLGAVLLVGEFFVHYLIDLGKGVWSERLGHTPADASYWRAFGADQTLHQLTYTAMLAAVIWV